MNNKNRTTSRLIVAATLLIWGVWDIFVYVTDGGKASISSVFGMAFTWPWMGWWFVGSYGFLCGHLAGMVSHDAEMYWGRSVALPLAAAILGFYLTWRQP